MIGSCSSLNIRLIVRLLGFGFLISVTGCQPLMTTAVLLWSGTSVPAEYAGLEGKRVVVICQPPSSIEYRHAGAARELSRRVGGLLAEHVKDIHVTSAREVDEWADENEWEDFSELAKAVNAEMVVLVRLETFSIHKGKTLYQGNAETTISVHDMQDESSDHIVWERPLGQILFPTNSAVPTQEKSAKIFRRQFIDMLSETVARHFYEHDPRTYFALDATAHR